LALAHFGFRFFQGLIKHCICRSDLLFLLISCASVVYWWIGRALTYNNSRPSQEHKVRCLAHYFERVTASTPTGFVSFERKVLRCGSVSSGITYPDSDAWMKSSVPLCPFRVSGALYVSH
jgi:hypothetical protein